MKTSIEKDGLTTAQYQTSKAVMNLSEELKCERLRLGINQAEASAICGVSPRAYWQWEKCASTLDVTLEGAIARLRKQKPRAKF